ncbi:YceI family protein [Sphingobacterium oryzagri]|uniref:YceI family protein n=1 Tax=Sphingobacterium oryzagri TaxID=3025669 RepID=A0ABY7WQG4_9SPHI|nr:YceI family protein [Sphingobacterium sp. KACC 22765]WDF69569.1 YceI family protein [Sphingobacterium sp. KACC 22765]
MKTKIHLALISSILLLSAFSTAWYAQWKIQEDDYVIAFETEKASGKIKGLEGNIVFDPQKPAAAAIDVRVDVNTLATGIWLKNNHAKAEDFFNVEKYPKIHFKSKSVKKAASGYLVDGTLTIKDVSKPVQIPFTFTEKGGSGLFEGTFDINRKDYNLIKNGVGEVVKIAIKLPVTQ